jgi:non-ribosomal peptide synthetase component E (peptide arylation enzyme)
MALPHLAAFSIAFFGYLRVGEIAMSNLNSNHIVKISDVAFDSKAEILYETFLSSSFEL